MVAHTRGRISRARAGAALLTLALLPACASAPQGTGDASPAASTASSTGSTTAGSASTAASTSATTGAACTFANPVAVGADPWVEFRDGYYYMAQSKNPEGQNSSIWVFRSRRLTDLMRDSVRVWTSPASGWNQTHVWAPEIRVVDGRWYIYYAAGRPGPKDAPFIFQRSGVLRASTDDPQGAWEDLGQIDTGGDPSTRADDVWAIDLTVYRLGGRLYAMWSGWENNTPLARTPQHLYIAPMSNPHTISGRRALVSSPTAAFERRVDPVDGLDLNEGPQFLERNGQVFVTYSTRESWLRSYRLGMLRLRSADADPMQASSWIKTGPVFAEANGVYGPGHNGFAKSPDGTQDWLIYHAKVDTLPNWNRVIRMQPFTWRADGSPDFGEPVAAGVRLPVPSGEPCDA